MKQFEITSCPPKLRGDQRITDEGLLRVQPFTPKLVNGNTYWITKAEVSVRTAWEAQLALWVLSSIR
jgi:hypothetical protein